MPSRGERTAPQFDNTKARELGRFFKELELLFDARPGLTEQEKKDHVIRYLTMEDADIWVTVSEYDDGMKTFDDFKTAVLKLYPSASNLYRHSMNDLDLLIGNRLRLRIYSTVDLAEYMCAFQSIAHALVQSSISGESDVQCTYIRGFQPQLWMQVINHLQITNPNLAALPPYPINDVYNAATWYLTANCYDFKVYI